MPISADAGVIPALVSASFTFSRASGGVTMYHAEPSSFRSSAPASSTRSSSWSSLAASLGTEISPLRWNIHPTAPASAKFPPFLLIKWRNSPTTRLRFVVTARSIPLEGHFFVLLAFELPRAAQDGALDVVVRHVLVLRRENRRAQARIGVGIASADARRNRDFSNDSSKRAAALRVSRRFLMLNGGPF